MGYYVHIHVSFSCDRNEGVAALASKHLALLLDDYSIREARWFLEDLAARTGINPGPKGGLSLWGITGNYTRADEFCETLRPFWLELLSEPVDGGPFDFERIIVMSEREQTEQAEAHEIWLDEDTKALTIKHHMLPFAWMQH